MKLWKVLARTSYIHNATPPTTNATELQEMKCRSPTWSDDSGKHSSPSALSVGASGRPVFATTVEIRKLRGESLGIVFAQGGSGESGPTIASLRPGSAAGRCDQLSPGDRVRSVNGISSSKMRPADLSSLLDNVIGDAATLDLEYTMPEYSSQGSLCVQTKVTTVTLERVDGSLGITLRGGVLPGASAPSTSSSTCSTAGKPLVVTHVRPGGPAHRSGRIKVGDRLVKVDHHSLANKTLLDAHALLKAQTPTCGDSLRNLAASLTSLTIEYDVSVLEGVKCAAGALLVEVERRNHECLGLVLGSGDVPVDEIVPAGVYVESIVPASIADRCGALHVGDQILAVDDTYVEGSSASPEEVTWLLQNYDAGLGTTRLQIMPCHALANPHQNTTTDWLHRGVSPSMSSFSTVSRRSRSRYRCSKLSSEPAGLPAAPGAGRGLCHVETVTVALRSVQDLGYGFTVNVDGDGDKQANIVVAAVDVDSPAYRCGCLQTSDRLISLNGQCSLTLQEVRALLDLGCSNPGSRLLLQTEFDVADTVVPTSGVFTVRIAKNGPDLGITITASKTIQDDPFLISDVRRGSAAHRTGTLHVGDQVLAIDDRLLDHPGLDEAFDGVQNSQTEVVTLRIQKIEECLRQQHQSSELPEEITYTVELNRRGGPLGITVSGSEDRVEPIVLSALTQGGLAEKTGALHVGDRILAINSENLEQRPLSDAIRLLQTSGDKIQIKIARQLKTNTEENDILSDTRGTYSSPGLTSIDSAVESWDSGVLDTPSDLHQAVRDNSLETISKHLDNLTTNMSATNTCPFPLTSFSSHQYSQDGRHPDGDIRHLEQDGRHLEQDGRHLEPEGFEQRNQDQYKHVQRQQNFNLNAYEDILSLEGNNKNNNNGNRMIQSQLLFYSDVEDSLCPSPLPLPNYNFTNTLPKYDSSYFFCSKPSLSSRNEYKYSRQDADSVAESATLADVEVHYVTLHKDNVYDDYGFSVSDGLYEKGVYINRIRRGGPAHLAAVLRPYDRILQVNETKTKDFDCCLTVPLIASAGDRIELVIARNPYIGCPDEKDIHVLSWTPDEQDLQRITANSFTSSQNTITKTL